MEQVLIKAENNGYEIDKLKVFSDLIMDQDFAQAFWKDEKSVILKVTFQNGNSAEQEVEGWQYWLSQFILADDQEEFMARFLVVKGGE